MEQGRTRSCDYIEHVIGRGHLSRVVRVRCGQLRVIDTLDLARAQRSLGTVDYGEAFGPPLEKPLIHARASPLSGS